MASMTDVARCKRVSRICTKIVELLDNDLPGDMDELLTNVERTFLLLSEYFHTDIDLCENTTEREICDETHRHIDKMYEQVMQTVIKNQTTLAHEEKNLWFNTSFPDIPSFVALKEDTKDSPDEESYKSPNSSDFISHN